MKGEARSSPYGLVISPLRGSLGRWRSERVDALAERLWNVQIENSDALRLLERLAREETAVIYCDPPYYSADHSPYSGAPDFEALAEALKAQRGRVALSGYPGEWDSLGWHRSESSTVHRPIGAMERGKSPEPRREVLWTNYDPETITGRRLFG